eukprot:14177447-Ditylum_brightwellii.AAC.1
MDTVDDIVSSNSTDIEEDHLSNCWAALPCSVYSRHYLEKCEKTSSMTQVLTVSNVTDSNFPAVDGHQTTRETAVFLSKAAKQLDEWEVAAKACAKEQEESEKEISAYLDMLNEATKKTQESSIANKIAQ